MRVAIYAGMFKRNQDGATKTLYELVNSLLENNIYKLYIPNRAIKRQMDAFALDDKKNFFYNKKSLFLFFFYI